MQTPCKSQIKDSEGKFYLIKNEQYNSGTTVKITWIVAEKINDFIWKMEREFNRKYDAKEWLYICAKV